MGYETKLLIGKRVSFSHEDLAWFQIYAEIDLCKCCTGHIYEIEAHSEHNPVVYWFGSDGDTEMTEDKYGDKPIPLPIEKVLKAIRDDSVNDDYRRFKWAIALLESMKNDSENLEVLFYGH